MNEPHDARMRRVFGIEGRWACPHCYRLVDLDPALDAKVTEMRCHERGVSVTWTE